MTVSLSSKAGLQAAAAAKPTALLFDGYLEFFKSHRHRAAGDFGDIPEVNMLLHKSQFCGRRVLGAQIDANEPECCVIPHFGHSISCEQNGCPPPNPFGETREMIRLFGVHLVIELLPDDEPDALFIQLAGAYELSRDVRFNLLGYVYPEAAPVERSRITTPFAKTA